MTRDETYQAWVGCYTLSGQTIITDGSSSNPSCVYGTGTVPVCIQYSCTPTLNQYQLVVKFTGGTCNNSNDATNQGFYALASGACDIAGGYPNGYSGTPALAGPVGGNMTPITITSSSCSPFNLQGTIPSQSNLSNFRPGHPTVYIYPTPLPGPFTLTI